MKDIEINSNKKIEKIIRNSLITLTLINLILNFIIFPAMTYNGSSSFEITHFYNSILNSSVFLIFIWSFSILTYIVGLIHIIISIKNKNNVMLKIYLTIVTMLYTPLSINLIMNFLAEFFYL